MNIRMILPGLLLGCAAMFTIPSTAVAQSGYNNGYNNEQQPHMTNALEHLRQAQQELQAAEKDKGGHRVEALKLIDQAQREVQAGIQYDDSHESRGENGRDQDYRDRDYRNNGGPIHITSGPTIETLDDHSAVVAWGTNVQGSSRVEYGLNGNNLTELAEAPWGAGGLTHRVRIDNLRPNTTYFFTIETEQARGTGREVEGARTYSFRTLPNGAGPIHNQQPR